MTIEDFEENISAGKKYVLLDNYVINIKSFIDEHPGGSAILKHHIGKDIGKFFHGAYSFTPSYPKHSHSRDALKIVEKLIISKITNYNREDYYIKTPETRNSQNFSIEKSQKLKGNLYRVSLTNAT
mmetsp:Transcript_24524/g.21767  ORF Transcript_24524/g.21767 Transcript_24524/m.21767 type:complete len:126 (+) Transcript_24524:87-464(+)